MYNADEKFERYSLFPWNGGGRKKKKKEKFEKIGRETVDGGGRKECGNCNDIARNT